MSKLETGMTRWYWRHRTGGLLIEEYPVVLGGNGAATRRVDGLVILGERTRRVSGRRPSVAGKDVVVIQAKAKPLGMSVMGQALFSAELVRNLGARSVRSVAVCTKDDSVLRPLLEAHEAMEVAVVPAVAASGRARRRRSRG
jgi:hypothetical protein